MPERNDSFRVPEDDLEAFSRQMQAINRSASSFSTTLAKGLKSALVDGKSLESVFRQIALSTSSRILGNALQPLERLAGSAADSLFGALTGGAFAAGGKVTPFARGGVIASPTYFGLGSNGQGEGGGLGLAGEAGAEAILPLVRDTNGRLGVGSGAGSGSGGNQPRIQINVATRDLESFRRSETQISAMVARAVGRGRRGL